MLEKARRSLLTILGVGGFVVASSEPATAAPRGRVRRPRSSIARRIAQHSIPFHSIASHPITAFCFRGLFGCRPSYGSRGVSGWVPPVFYEAAGRAYLVVVVVAAACPFSCFFSCGCCCCCSPRCCWVPLAAPTTRAPSLRYWLPPPELCPLSLLLVGIGDPR